MKGAAMASFSRQVFLVLGRSFRRAKRDPAMAFVFPIAFPVMMIVLFSQIYEKVGALPDFPADSYIDWIAPAVVLMAAMFGAGHSALGLIEDAQSGYLDRLRLLPVRPAALMLGRLLFDVIRVSVAGLLVLGVAILMGADFHGGLFGAATIVLLLALWTLGYAGMYYVVGLKTRKAEALTGLVPMFLPISLLSTAYIPRDLAPTWVERVASFNPYSYVVDGIRMFTSSHFDAGIFWAAITGALVMILLTQIGAARRFAAFVHAD
jgi:ABC-2 type transport system permease protein